MSLEAGATVEPPTELRTYEYQDGPYFLTLADGPWGARDWTYDRIGNRLTESRDRSGTPETDTYTYEPNAGSNNASLLDEILLSPTGTADYAWDAAGNLETLVRGANHLAFTFDEASRMSEIDRGDGVTVVEPDDVCIEKCLKRKFAEPRPYYGLAGPGTNCQEWADGSLFTGRNECNPPPPVDLPSFKGFF